MYTPQVLTSYVVLYVHESIVLVIICLPYNVVYRQRHIIVSKQHISLSNKYAFVRLRAELNAQITKLQDYPKAR